jgi:hypothetical protein
MDDHTIHPTLTKDEVVFSILVTPLDIKILALQSLINYLKFN